DLAARTAGRAVHVVAGVRSHERVRRQTRAEVAAQRTGRRRAQWDVPALTALPLARVVRRGRVTHEVEPVIGPTTGAGHRLGVLPPLQTGGRYLLEDVVAGHLVLGRVRVVADALLGPASHEDVGGQRRAVGRIAGLHVGGLAVGRGELRDVRRLRR